MEIKLQPLLFNLTSFEMRYVTLGTTAAGCVLIP